MSISSQYDKEIAEIISLVQSSCLAPYEEHEQLQSAIKRSGSEARERINDLLVRAMIDEVTQVADAYPFEEEDSVVDAKRVSRGEPTLNTLTKYLNERSTELHSQLQQPNTSNE